MKTKVKKVCPICLRTFTPNAHNQKFCHFCFEHCYDEIKEYRKKMREVNRIVRATEYKFSKILLEIEKYNKKHGTCLSYGKYVHMKTYGLLEE